MRNLSKFTILGAVLVVATAFASADTVQLGSYRTSQPARGNQNHAMGFAGSRGNTFDIGTGGVWTAAAPHSSWVSQNVGDCPGCGNVEPNGTYTFQTSFSLSNADDSGSIFVMADDTTDVLLNGHLLQTFSGGPNSTCHNSQPNCTVPLLVSLPLGDLANGTNNPTFDVHQTKGSAEGRDFYGSVSSLPEPSTLFLPATGLIGSAGAMFRRMRM
jgi:hypothetical protein